jgi:demethylmenaquinone methyltransferase / 2-methoxy-6-polyprenyl-1,4-benzoquinol methylase
VTLRSEIATAEGKRRYVRRLFATIADRYDFITRFLSYGQDQRWKRRLIELADIGANDRVLDLACGTGDIVDMAAHRARSAVGLDVTLRMLQLAATRFSVPGSRFPVPGSRVPGSKVPDSGVRRSQFGVRRRTTNPELPEPGTGNPEPRELGTGNPEPGTQVSLVCGDMLALPFPAEQFDVVTIGYGLRNAPDLAHAIQEIHRVLAPGGRMLSLDFNRPENAIVRVAYLVYLSVVGSVVGWTLHGDPDTYRYISESIRNYPGARGVARLLEQRGFMNVRVIPMLGGFMTIHAAIKDSSLVNSQLPTH